MSDIQYFLTDCGIEVNVDPIFHKKFNDCYGSEFNIDELIFMLSKLGVDVKKLQAENAELNKQSKWISVDVTDVKIGSTLTYRNGKESIVYDVSDVVNDGINGGVAQCRIWANVIDGKGVYHTYRKDGVSHYESGYDIVKITPPEGE